MLTPAMWMKVIFFLVACAAILYAAWLAHLIVFCLVVALLALILAWGSHQVQQDEERAAKAKASGSDLIDYRALLTRYLAQVLDSEGVTFLHHEDQDGTYLSAADKAELLRLRVEAKQLMGQP
jgi:hypothetical protein